MRISRRGSSADFGESTIIMDKSSFSWDEKNSTVKIQAQRIKDFSTDSRHNYEIYVSVEEIAQVISVLAKAAMEKPGEIEQCMASSLKDLVRLQAVVAGLVHH